ncbi:MAG: ABC transporter ATP-binding protein [Candidatus Dormibacteraeota bacterium]|uniref:ABC transporter ATP-binding protein n=1 Tax=Candidatus Amunia macphersoniae TaxID=3127014 RepID=A0A934NFA1_9BACT|nr:ABC transporter ATP-binding protein [Candidatus Dormibacteraeota bacterium]
MSVPRGEVFGFLGPNGAGKTTAVKLLLGLTSPTAGDAWLLGEPVGKAEARRRVGYLPELFRYPAWLSAAEVLSFHCRLIGVPRPVRATEVESALTEVGLRQRAHDRVGTFSKGMQQRLGLAVAMLGAPEMVFLDEPTSALDPVGRHDVREIIRALRAKGTAVFLNSHLLTEVEQVCDRVAVVDHGRVVAAGTLDDILGGGAMVRLHLTGLEGVNALLARWGDVTVEGDWVSVRGVDANTVADIVADLVARGARVHAVEPQRQSLEDRFLELLQGSGDEVAA